MLTFFWEAVSHFFFFMTFFESHHQEREKNKKQKAIFKSHLVALNSKGRRKLTKYPQIWAIIVV